MAAAEAIFASLRSNSLRHSIALPKSFSLRYERAFVISSSLARPAKAEFFTASMHQSYALASEMSMTEGVNVRL